MLSRRLAEAIKLGEHYLKHMCKGSLCRITGGRRCGAPHLPLLGEPSGELVDRHGRQADQQLGKVKLRIDIVAAAGACQAGQHGGRSSTARVAHEE